MARPRGILVSLLQREINGFPLLSVGEHVAPVYRKILNEPVRNIKQLYFLNKTKIDICVSFGAIGIGIPSKLKGVPYVVFEDDELYKLDIYIAKTTATRFVIPSCLKITGRNVYTYSGFKELAYLHPKYFKPNKGVLKNYGLEKYSYLFVRQVKRTPNYSHLKNIFPELLRELNKRGNTILLSLEDKSLIDVYKDNTIILKEPVDDLYSLIKYASLTISEGDTMARESCLLGSPAIYTGGRIMSVNNELIRRGCMFTANSMQEILKTIDYIIDKGVKNEVGNKIKYSLEYEWIDTTEVILKHLLEFRE